jgi:hypothetical protein
MDLASRGEAAPRCEQIEQHLLQGIAVTLDGREGLVAKDGQGLPAA